MTIGVVLATFNGIRFIQEQLDSIINQTIKPDEIIISDDNSNDGTYEFLIKYQKEHPSENITVLKNLNNGITNNFFNAFNSSHADILFFSDQDDIWKKDKIQVFMTAVDKHPECALFFSNADLYLYPDNTVIGNCWDVYFLKEYRDMFSEGIQNDGSVLDQKVLIEILLNVGNIVTGMCMAVKREILNSISIENYAILHDDQITCYSAINSYVCAIECCTALYRQHSDNVIGGIGSKKRNSILNFTCMANMHFETFLILFLHYKQLYKYDFEHQWECITKRYQYYNNSYGVVLRSKWYQLRYLFKLLISRQYTTCLFSKKSFNLLFCFLSDIKMILFLKNKDKKKLLKKFKLI